MSMTASGSILRSLEDLRDLEVMTGFSSTEGYSENFTEFFALPDRLLRAGSRRVVVFRNEDLRAVAAHPAAGNMPVEVLSRRAYLDMPATKPIADAERTALVRILFNQVFTVNPPLHKPIRQVFARPLMPKFMPRFAAISDRLAVELIGEVAGRGDIDFSFDFTEALTARFWGELLGMTFVEQARVVEVVRIMAPFFFIERTREETVEINAATGEYLQIVSTAVQRSLAAGNNALLNDMAAEFDAIDLPGKPENLGISIAANLIDGFHTAALAAANVVYQLLKSPSAMSEVRADSQLVRNALAEGLRLSPPVIVTHRYALEDFEMHGVAIPAGTAIAMLWSAGNRDPAVFEDPNVYVLTRRPRPDATFGGGVHICPGRNVARVIAESVLRAVTAPDVRIELTGEVRWIARSTMRQPHRMPVTISRA